MEKLVEIRDVSFAYRVGAEPVLRQVSLCVEQGEFIAVVGANGSGKSTLGKLVSGLVAPTEGAVEVRGAAGMVFQNPDNQIVASIVEEDVAFGPENLGLESTVIRARVDEALETVGLSRCARREASNLSGGQKQLVAIAGVLAMRPDTIVFDEPGAMLDPRHRAQVTALAHELNDAGLTVILITHFMDDALGADRVVALDHGTVSYDGAPEGLLADAEHLERLGLELPFAARLSQALEKRGICVNDALDLDALKEELCR